MKKAIILAALSLLIAAPLVAAADDYSNDDSNDASLNGPEVPQDPPDSDPPDDDDSQGSQDVADDIQKFKDLNAQADRAADNGNWNRAIALWQESIQYDRGPYAPCRGALQQVYIQVAQQVIQKLQSQDLDPGSALRYFRAEVTNNWGDSPCDAP